MGVSVFFNPYTHSNFTTHLTARRLMYTCTMIAVVRVNPRLHFVLSTYTHITVPISTVDPVHMTVSMQGSHLTDL